MLPPGSDVRWLAGGTSEAELRDADVFVGSTFTPEMARNAERLRLVHPAAAGTDKIDFTALSRNILVANTFHHERSIAEYVVGAAVMLHRGFLTQDARLREGAWATSVYDPSIPQTPTLGEAHALMARYHISGVPITEIDRLIGILTNRDLRFETRTHLLVSELMTRENLITVSVGTTFRKELAEKGIIFCSMSEAIREHPELVRP